MSPKNTTSSVFINHLGLVRGRFQGDGDLLVTAYSYNQAAFKELAPITLEEYPDKFVETLANFKKQKMQIDFGVETVDEWFNFGAVIPFIKPVESGYPRG